MESFGDLLSRLLTEKHMTVYALAKRTGVERSFIQKMKSGARVPQDRNVAATLARGLSLTMTEQSRFMEAYFRSQMGEDLYHERSLVRDILTGFYTERGASPMVEMSSENRIHLPEHTALIKGRPQVNRMVRAVLEMEASKKDGRILLLTQPSFRFLYDTLSTMDLDANHTEVLNIIRFNKDSSTDHFYNLEVFKSLAPILFVQKNFKPYYVYEYVQAIYNPSSFLPYAILTGDYGMHVSYDTASALVYDRKDIRDLAADSFRKKLTAASPLLTTVNAAPEDYFYTIGPLMDWDSDNLNVMYQPCLIPFCPQSVMEKAINPAVFTPPR